MPYSGVEVSAEIKALNNAEKTAKQFQYIVFDIKSITDADNKILKIWNIKTKMPRQSPGSHTKMKESIFRDIYTKFVETELNDDAAVFAIYDFDNFELESGAEHKLKRVAFQWCPDNLMTKDKMLFASSVELLKKAVADNTLLITGNEKNEVSLEQIIKAARK